MKKRSFDEMIAYFNRRVADMNISQDCKMELVGMITAIGYEHETSVPHWIPCSERLPKEGEEVFVYLFKRQVPYIAWVEANRWYTEDFEVERENEPVAWMPLPEPYKGGDNETCGR